MIDDAGPLTVVVTVTLLCIVVSVAITVAVVSFFDQPIQPAIWLASVTPTVIAPFIVYTFVDLIRAATSAEQNALDREKALAIELEKRREAENDLLKLQIEQRSFFDNTPAMLHSVDADGRVVSVSDYWLRRLSYEREEVLGRQTVDFLTEESRDFAINEALPEFRRLGETRHAKYDFVTKSGEIVPCSLSAIAEYDSAGNFAQGVAIITEISDIKNAQKALIESERKFRAVTEYAGDAFFLHDKTGKILEVNEAACKSLGYSRDELIRMHVSEVEIGFDPGALQAHWDELTLGGAITLHGEHTRKDGTAFPIEARIGIVQIGEDHQILALVRDISLRVSDEEERRQLQSELAHYGRLNLLGEMATGLAHELNQPLAASSSYVQGAVRRLKNISEVPDAITDSLTKAYEQTLRAGDIIRWLREFVKKSDSGSEVTDINAAINEIFEVMELDVRFDNIKMIYDLAEGLPDIQADPIQLQQILLNLIRNSYEALSTSTREDKRLEIKTRRLENDFVQVTVRDNGPGILPSDREKVFDRFYTTKGDGIGMGLAICRTVIDHAGGSIWVEGGTDGTTDICFTIPPYETPERDTAEAPAPLPAAQDSERALPADQPRSPN